MMTKARAFKAVLLGAVLSVLFALPAWATPPSTSDEVKTAVTPEFNNLKTLAIDLIPLALGVIAVAVMFRLAIGWFKRARS
jgi:hypothetical protein